MRQEDQELPEGPQLRSVTRYNRAAEERSWRQEALWELEGLEDDADPGEAL